MEQAIRNAGGGNLCGTIHHSDRGVQYCCDEYITCLKSHHIRISMTEDGNPTDNAIAERANGIIKGEFIDPVPTPRNLQEAAALVEHAVQTYNNLRPHLSLQMRTPAEVYYGLKGHGLLLIEREDGVWKTLPLEPGVASYVPRGFAHRSINTGSEPLEFFFAFRADAGHNYGRIEISGFSHIVTDSDLFHED